MISFIEANTKGNFAGPEANSIGVATAQLLREQEEELLLACNGAQEGFRRS